MYPDRQIVLDHASKDRPEFRSAQRLACDMGEDLHAARAQGADGAIDLGERRIDIVHGQGGNKCREMIAMPGADFGKRIVCDPCELGRHIGTGHELERRVGERQHILQIPEPLEQPQPRIDVAERREARKGSHGHMARYQTGETPQIRGGHEMVEDVDFHALAVIPAATLLS